MEKDRQNERLQEARCSYENRFENVNATNKESVNSTAKKKYKIT